MSSKPGQHNEEHLDRVYAYALQSLPHSEVPIAEAEISACAACRQELETLWPSLRNFFWAADILRPSPLLWQRLANRIAAETGKPPLVSPLSTPVQAEWEEAAPGISVKLLASDFKKSRVSMLVRLAPETDYPPHRHAGPEELYLLHGELMIDDKKVYPGDYIRAKAGSVDHRVWSETGCTCVLITSTEDVIL